MGPKRLKAGMGDVLLGWESLRTQKAWTESNPMGVGIHDTKMSLLSFDTLRLGPQVLCEAEVIHCAQCWWLCVEYLLRFDEKWHDTSG